MKYGPLDETVVEAQRLTLSRLSGGGDSLRVVLERDGQPFAFVAVPTQELVEMLMLDTRVQDFVRWELARP